MADDAANVATTYFDAWKTNRRRQDHGLAGSLRRARIRSVGFGLRRIPLPRTSVNKSLWEVLAVLARVRCAT
jgi:hypothetical protein